MTLAAQDGSLQVVLLCRNISAFSIFGEFQIAGFSVEVSQDPEQSPGRKFHIFDDEDNIIHLFCREIEILQAGPMEI